LSFGTGRRGHDYHSGKQRHDHKYQNKFSHNKSQSPFRSSCGYRSQKFPQRSSAILVP
jgi:hypothetical protein